MATDHTTRSSHIFALRLWQEETGAGQQEWRGRIYDAATRDVRYFREWASLISLLLAMLRDAEQSQERTND
ncbi:MAG: hypothetical protein R2867_27530 [Caldilineaceae bacterium]